MNEIDMYIKGVFKNVRGNKKEIADSKAEMKNHLHEAIQELIYEGRTEQEATRIAIERFGEETELRSMITQMFITQKHFSRSLLIVGISILIVAVLIAGYFLKVGDIRVSEQSTIVYDIGNLVENTPQITNATAIEIEKKLNTAGYIKELNIFEDNNKNTEIYNYNNNEMFLHMGSFLHSNYRYGMPSENVTIEIVIFDYRELGFLCILLGVVSFLILFLIWLYIYMYQNRNTVTSN